MTKERTLNVLIIRPDNMYRTMFKNRGWKLVTSIFDADLVQFTGGEDVNPTLYHEQHHPRTFDNPSRDKEEQEIYEQAQELGIPCAGICRGGQFLNIMNGGKMYQDVDGHDGVHSANVNGLGVVKVSSTHHQMMRPSLYKENIVLMTANESSYKESKILNKITHLEENNVDFGDDVEAIYYPNSNSLCYQPHPEYPGYDECQEMYFYFINNYLMNGGASKEEVEKDLGLYAPSN